jgi:NAD(P)-dependent dehydrogenase (short-subunit alcohol dehydrogenase family)
MLLRDKVIVISGVGPGLGQTLAKMAAQEGAAVVLGARSQDFLDAVATEIRDAGGKAIALSTDVTSTQQCQALVAAGVKMGDVINVICQGALRMAQACAPHMHAAGGGSIVNVSTMSTVKPFAGETMYAAGKGALNALTRHMANDFGKFSIRVNSLRMGWIGGAPVYAFIDSQVAAGADRDAVVSSITDRIPLGVIPPETDCAKAVLAFLSDYSAVITGSSVDVNGGEYMAP